MDDEWREINVEEEVVATSSQFTFAAKDTAGMLAALDDTSSPLTCFMELFDREVLTKLLDSINSYAGKYTLLLNNK